jgi:hypothetical protein
MMGCVTDLGHFEALGDLVTGKANLFFWLAAERL